MRVLDLDVRWCPQYDTAPIPVVMVDRVPDFTGPNTPLRYRRQPMDGQFEGFWAMEPDTGLVNFFAQGPDHSGFNGHSFHLPMVDGSSQLLVGPWSSRAAEMNRYFPPCLEVLIADRTNFTYGRVAYWHVGSYIRWFGCWDRRGDTAVTILDEKYQELPFNRRIDLLTDAIRYPERSWTMETLVTVKHAGLSYDESQKKKRQATTDWNGYREKTDA